MHKAQKIVLSLFIILIVYSNTAVLLKKTLNEFGITTPLHKVIYDSFIMFGMFSFYTERGKEISIWGLSEPSISPAFKTKPRWMMLRTGDFFPFKRGEISRAWVNKHWRSLGKAAQTTAWKDLALKIRNRHNRLHPESRISKVSIGAQIFPQGDRWFREYKDERSVVYSNWYTEK